MFAASEHLFSSRDAVVMVLLLHLVNLGQVVDYAPIWIRIKSRKNSFSV